MPPKSKGKAKGLTSPPSTRAAKPPPTPPIPFSRAPEALQPILSKLSKQHIYISSLDAQPWKFKAQIFAVPFLMNASIIVLLLWRIWYITPYYFALLSSLLGHPNETTLYPELMTRHALLSAIGSRALTLLADLGLYVALWPWPRAFFGPSEHENPMAWRVLVGFSDQEIVVRRSRRWDETLGDVVMEGGEGSPGGLLFLTKVRAAMARSYMHERTGYSMLNKDWDLDWRLMIVATELVGKKEMSLNDFDTTVLVHSEVFGWVVFEAQDKVREENKREEEGRRKILAFKDELTKRGKENLFYRWIELVQFESSQPDGFGPARQQETVLKAKEMFEAQGIDFEEFWAKIGGMDGLPGMDQS